MKNGENVYSVVFGVAVYQPLIRFKIQNGEFKMAATGIKNRDNIDENINLGGFRRY